LCRCLRRRGPGETLSWSSGLPELCKTGHHPSPTLYRSVFLLQVLCQKQTDSPEVKQVSVRRFATFDLFRRKNLSAQEHCDTSDVQWVEYKSVYYPEYGAFLRDNLGPLKVNEVLNSFDNTGNFVPCVCVGSHQVPTS
uniref:Uncharacterized protein n=1 Tax=Poecilia reticulata TaxID=8081 RepID=A0A3P9N5W7_POERE